MSMFNAIVVLALVQISLIVGFILGKMSSRKEVTHERKTPEIVRKFDFSSPTKNQSAKNVSIDDSVYVTSVASNNLQKSGTDLGKTTIVEDNIESSVSKLAHLKKSK